jgi:hypothetical protein
MLPSLRSVTRFSGSGQVLGGEPEVDGVLGDLVERPLRRELGLQRLLAAVHLGARLADHLDVAQRVVDVGAAEVEVVEPERLLEHGRVRLLGEREHRLAGVEHVVAADLVGAVRQPARVLSLAEASSSLALLAAPQETTTRSPA